MAKKYKGSCLCGAVSFTVTGFSDRAANCHCSMCRKFHGAAYGTLVGVFNLKWLTGSFHLKEFISPNGAVRTFCKECGSSLGFRVKGAPLSEMELAIATFDEAIPVEIDAHIYIDYKADWCKLQDNLSKFGEGRVV
ncbi:GFA family protein [Neptunomonas sp.]|uniref:GFA family protein n=1 Tax=Neptunomonas sp. TaxID=1971898 RepID=UPI003563EE32